MAVEKPEKPAAAKEKTINRKHPHAHLSPPLLGCLASAHLFSMPFREDLQGQKWNISGLLLAGDISPITPSAQGKLFTTHFALPQHGNSKLLSHVSLLLRAPSSPKPRSTCKRIWQCLGLTQLLTMVKHKERGESMPFFFRCIQPSQQPA